jgi:WD40 repeat protein
MYSHQGDQLVSANGDNTVKLWDVEPEECLLTFTGHNDRVQCVTYSPQGKLLASGSENKSVRIWDVATGQCRAVVEDFQGGVRSISWSDSRRQSFEEVEMGRTQVERY